MTSNKFGVFLPTGNLDDARAAAVRAESDGFYSVSINDHFYSPLGDPATPQLECFTALTAVALETSRVRLVPSVIAASFRNPAMLAKILSTLDLASNGRLVCGLGAGWQDTEYRAHGYAFPSLRERLEQLDETLQVLKAMFYEASPHFDGRHFHINEAYNNPRPQQAKMPVMLGGSGTGLLRIAAREADIVNLIPPTGNGRDFVNDPAVTMGFDMARLKQRIATLHGFMSEAGREPDSMELSGLALVGLSRDADDDALRQLASNLGFTDYGAAQRSPVALIGTPAEVRRELAQRIAETGVTYYILIMATPDAQSLFANEVMPEFV